MKIVIYDDAGSRTTVNSFPELARVVRGRDFTVLLALDKKCGVSTLSTYRQQYYTSFAARECPILYTQNL